jgi:hypothetical protein
MLIRLSDIIGKPQLINQLDELQRGKRSSSDIITCILSTIDDVLEKHSYAVEAMRKPNKGINSIKLECGDVDIIRITSGTQPTLIAVYDHDDAEVPLTQIILSDDERRALIRALGGTE